MLSTSDFKKGLRVELDGQPWTVVSVSTQSPSARGAATLVKARLKNVLNGQVSDRTFKSGEKFDEPDLLFRASQYLYAQPGPDGETHVFMDNESYDQFELTAEDLGDQAGFLSDNLEVKAVVYNGQVVGVELPQFVEVELVSVEPGTRGDTQSGGVTTAAYTTSGLRVQVPLYIKEGDRIRIDTTDGSFKDRA